MQINGAQMKSIMLYFGLKKLPCDRRCKDSSKSRSVVTRYSTVEATRSRAKEPVETLVHRNDEGVERAWVKTSTGVKRQPTFINFASS